MIFRSFVDRLALFLNWILGVTVLDGSVDSTVRIVGAIVFLDKFFVPLLLEKIIIEAIEERIDDTTAILWLLPILIVESGILFLTNGIYNIQDKNVNAQATMHRDPDRFLSLG